MSVEDLVALWESYAQRRTERAAGMSIGAISDEPVLWRGRPYFLNPYPEAPEYLVLKDAMSDTFLAHESEVENGLESRCRLDLFRSNFKVAHYLKSRVRNCWNYETPDALRRKRSSA
jgi:hypothetical protein